jgi:hypothetical protein
MKLAELVQSLPHDQLMRMQQLSHNMMAGLDVRKDAEEFERTLPPGFKEKLMAIMIEAQGAAATSQFQQSSMGIRAEPVSPAAPAELPGDVREARLTVLRAVADGRMSPEDADRLLFEETV